jgi:predicted nucleotidyltransferase
MVPQMFYLEEIQRELRTLNPELTQRFYVNSIGLFGSIVRDDFFLKKSDIDIIVDFTRPVGIEFIALTDYLENKFHRKIDLVSKKGIKPAYYSVIEKEILYV